MEVLPLTSIFEKLQLTVTSAEIVLTSLGNETEIVLSSEISSLPTYNCNMVFRKMDSNDSMIGQMCFRSGRPLVTAEISVNYKNFEKLEKCNDITNCSICFENMKDNIKLKCDHIYCSECIKKWLTERSNTCPTCRTEI